MDYDVSKIMEKAPIYTGKAKSIYEIEGKPSEVLVEFRDDITAGNGAKHDVKSGKGYLNTVISNELFKVLEKNNVPTHLIEYIERNNFV